MPIFQFKGAFKKLPVVYLFFGSTILNRRCSFKSQIIHEDPISVVNGMKFLFE